MQTVTVLTGRLRVSRSLSLSLRVSLCPSLSLRPGLGGEVESSCSHPREAMNLVHVRRISRRKPNCRREEEEEEGLFKANAVNEEEGKLLFIEGYSTTSSAWTHQRMRPSPLLPASVWLAPRSLGQMLVCPRGLGELRTRTRCRDAPPPAPASAPPAPRAASPPLTRASLGQRGSSPDCTRLSACWDAPPPAPASAPPAPRAASPPPPHASLA